MNLSHTGFVRRLSEGLEMRWFTTVIALWAQANQMNVAMLNGASRNSQHRGLQGWTLRQPGRARRTQLNSDQCDRGQNIIKDAQAVDDASI